MNPVRASSHPSLGPGLRRRVATVGILVGLVVAAFEGTVVTSAMPRIVSSLGGVGRYPWVFSAFLAASTLGVLVFGKLADAHGRRPVFIVGMGVFLTGSVLCGASNTIRFLIAARALQGFGAGAIQPLVMTISADLYSLRERARVQGLFTSAWGAANVLGPLLGGWIVEHASWRQVFLVNVPVGLVAVALLAGAYRDPPRDRRGEGVPVGGAVLAGTVSVLLLLALESKGAVTPGERTLAIALALVGAVILVLHETRTSAPIVPLALLRDRVVQSGLLAGVAAGALLYACAAYVPLWLAQEHRLDAVRAGAGLVPLLAGWALGSTFGVRVFVARGMRASVAGGFAVATVGAIVLALSVALHAPTAVSLVALGVMGVGLGPAASTGLVGSQSRASWQHRGAVTSAVYATRTLGGSIAVAALGTVPATVHDAAAGRFAGVAVCAAIGAVVLALVAPGGAGGVDTEAVGAGDVG